MNEQHPMQGNSVQYRYERKYLVPLSKVSLARHLLRIHAYQFRKAFPDRQVNNIYLDTPSLDSYYDNIDGVAQRQKVRQRWYGEMLGQLPGSTLELKRKQGAWGNKESYPLVACTIDSEFGQRQQMACFHDSELPEKIWLELQCLQPRLLNHYQREYYLSQDSLFRITLDTALSFYNMSVLRNSFLGRWVEHTYAVLEFKYDQEHDELARRVWKDLPFRLSKSSKYVTGMNVIQYRSPYT